MGQKAALIDEDLKTPLDIRFRWRSVGEMNTTVAPIARLLTRSKYDAVDGGKSESGFVEPKRSPRLLSDQLLGEDSCEKIKEFVKCLIIRIIPFGLSLVWNWLLILRRSLRTDRRYGVIV